MTTPASHSSRLALRDSGPPSNFLRQLLDEINGTAVPTVPRKPNTRNTRPKPRPTPRSTEIGASSVWVGGASIAQDARVKLRAADEARFPTTPSQSPDGTSDRRPRLRLITSDLQLAPASSSKRRRSSHSESDMLSSDIKALPGHNKWYNNLPDSSSSQSAVTGMRPFRFSVGEKPYVPGSAVLRARFPPFLCNIESDVSSAPSVPMVVSRDSISPQTCNSDSPDKRAWNGGATDGTLTKKMRTMALPEQRTHAVQPDLDNISSVDTLSDGYNIPIRELTAFERLSTSPEDLYSAETPTARHSSRPELETTLQRTPPRTFTPIRVPAHISSVEEQPEQESTPSPPDTLTFAQPFQLVDGPLSIYRQDHGEAWKDFPLCLDCFRLRGSFNRILAHGYESCGGDYVLRGHYWEAENDDVDL